MPVATPDPSGPMNLSALQRAIKQLAELQMGPARRAAEQLAELQMGPIRRAAERAAALHMGPLRQAAEQLAALHTQPVLAALSAQSRRVDRLLSETLQSVGPTSLAEVWSEQEAGHAPLAGGATERVIDQLQVRLPGLSREAVRWLVVAWATAMVLASALYVSMEHPKGFDEVWARVGPPVVIAALANNILVANWKRPGDKK